MQIYLFNPLKYNSKMTNWFTLITFSRHLCVAGTDITLTPSDRQINPNVVFVALLQMQNTKHTSALKGAVYQ